MDHFVLILAAGEGSRLKSDVPKQFLELNGIPIIMHSLLAFRQADPTAKIYIALSKKNQSYWRELCKKYNFNIDHQIYIGGHQRSDSVFRGLQAIHKETVNNKNNSIVSIHDAARPFIDTAFILELLKAAEIHGSAVPVINLKSSLRQVDLHTSLNSLTKNREKYILTQTPQVFYFEKIYEGYQKLFAKSFCDDNECNNIVFDDASVYDLINDKPSIFMLGGREYNIKITTKLDYYLSDKIYHFFKNLK